MRELDPAAVSDIIDRVCARETFADVTPVWDNQPDTEVSKMSMLPTCVQGGSSGQGQPFVDMALRL